MSRVTEEAVRQVLSRVVDPDSRQDIVSSGMLSGLAVRDGLVLVHQGEGEGFWTLPGGRAEIGEPAE